MNCLMRKLSATALATYLKSPKQYYWRYIAGLEPVQPSVSTFDHDKLFGTLWAKFVDSFYHRMPEAENIQATFREWQEKTDGWVPEKAKDRLTKALEALMPQYYQTFRPDDGTRNGSELWLEDNNFVARLDGLSHEKVVHEVKSTSRSPNLTEQLWKVQHSLQVKLYCVMSEAKGHCVEFAFKDSPYQLFRGPVLEVSERQRKAWAEELVALGESILALGDDPNHYPCNPEGCCIVTKGYVGMCQYQALCDQGFNEVTQIAYKKREHQ